MKKYKIEIFLSYSSLDKKIAGYLKEGLEYYGLDVFLAHEDIPPTEEWEQALLKHLHDCDIFIPLLTNNFKTSEWTSQELGVALANNKFIIPISLGIVPYGFIKKIQAIKASLENYNVLQVLDRRVELRKIIVAIKKNLKFINILTEIAIESFLGSGTFDKAYQKADLLSEFTYTKKQVNRIIKGCIANSQIYRSWKAQRYIKTFMGKYVKLADKNLTNELVEKFNTA